MKRRSFIRTGLAASFSTFLPGVVFVSENASAEDRNPGSNLLTAQMIWRTNSIPVPPIFNGRASSISSSSDGHAAVQVPDLHPVFARKFLQDEVPADATIRLFCAARYRLYVNVVPRGPGPGRFHNQRPEYDTREIAAGARRGRNLIAVLVHRDAPTGRIMRHDSGFAAVVRLGHGTNDKTIASDLSWLSRSDLSLGSRDEAWSSIEEHIDARKGFDFADPGFSLTGSEAHREAGTGATMHAPAA